MHPSIYLSTVTILMLWNIFLGNCHYLCQDHTSAQPIYIRASPMHPSSYEFLCFFPYFPCNRHCCLNHFWYLDNPWVSAVRQWNDKPFNDEMDFDLLLINSKPFQVCFDNTCIAYSQRLLNYFIALHQTISIALHCIALHVRSIVSVVGREECR